MSFGGNGGVTTASESTPLSESSDLLLLFDEDRDVPCEEEHVENMLAIEAAPE